VGTAPSGKLLGNVLGAPDAENHYTSESDAYGSNFYSIQLNPQTYSNSSGTFWMQFVFSNDPTNNNGSINLQYWILGTGTLCGVFGHTHFAKAWQAGPNSSCYNTVLVSTAREDPNSLQTYSVQGTVTSGGNDVSKFCNNSTCYSVSLTDQIVHVSSWWTHAEWNVFGFCCGNKANFVGSGSTGTWLHIEVSEKDSSGNTFATSTVGGGYTGESSNLNDYSTVSGTTGYYVFTECQTTPC
jgi:hypothetical protein